MVSNRLRPRVTAQIVPKCPVAISER
jgi:hypothetical protein